MNDPAASAAWLDSNQRCLCAEFARICALLERPLAADRLRSAEQAAEHARRAMPLPPAIDVLAAAFALTPFERDVVLCAAGAAMDAGVARALQCGRGDAPALTFSRLLAELPHAHWSAASPAAPLRRMRLIELGPGALAAPLRVDERVLHFLAGLNHLDPRLQPFVRLVHPAPLLAEAQRAAGERIATALNAARGQPPLVQLFGDDADGQADVAALAAARTGRVLFALRAEDLPVSAAERQSFAALWTREAALLRAALLVEAHLPQADGLLADLAERLARPTIVGARHPFPVRCSALQVPVDRPDASERAALWRAALARSADGGANAMQPDPGVLALRLSARAISAAAAAARRAEAAGEDGAIAMRRAAAAHAGHALGELAQRLDARAGWDDLVLPADALGALRDIELQVRLRPTVYDAWGFGRDRERGLGITALFCGDSGTGKTLAAEVLAHALGLELYRIDLSTVVSKYIGETEKNIRRIFDAAEDSGAILLFDEADALFGKRSEVRDSHDRYANISVSYLLQRMESYAGLAILTTNSKASLDRAFHRRLRFVVQFPFPTAELRERIWQRVIPATAPTRDLDAARLARLNVSGGAIRNIALNAAFRAAAAGEAIGMRHVAGAARAELGKDDKAPAEAQMREWA
jgi:hypothetical protein